MDVYIDVPPRRRVWLVDLAPWGPTTDPLLFQWDSPPLDTPEQQWDETASGVVNPVFRFVEDESQCRMKKEVYHQFPQELIELGTTDGAIEKLVQRVEQQLSGS